ncbi:MAG: hypothetical protein U0325_15175 [Polyangiales bacterium]
MTPPPPPAHAVPRLTPLQTALRVVLLAACCAAMIGVAQGAQRLRDTWIHAPVCARVCGARGQRYEGVTQHRKSDAAAACRCVGPGFARAEVPTRFFSENAVVDFFARELTSTLGLLFVLGLLVLGGLAVVAPKRSPPA